MAAVLNAVAGLAVTTNLANYAGTSHTPVVGDLIVTMYPMSDNASADNQTCTSSANGLTFSGVKTTTWPVARTSLDKLFAFVSNQLVPASPVAQILTLGTSSDLASGCVHCTARITGMTRTGASAIRQTAQASDGTTGTAPAITFPSACLTTNPVLFAWLGGSVAGVTPPTGFTEMVDLAYLTPSINGGYAEVDSGFTGTTITLGSVLASSWAAIGIELDTSAPGASFDPRLASSQLDFF